MNAIFCRFPLINAVLSRSQNGMIFNEVIPGSRTSFVIHKSGFSFLALEDGEVIDDRIFEFFRVTDEIPSYFHIYDAADELIHGIAGRDRLFGFRLRKRIQLKYTTGTAHFSSVHELPAGYKICRISQENFGELSVFGLALDSKFWNSATDFLSEGFGYAVYNAEGMAVSVCYAACVANRVAEIDVATLPGFQRKGLAKAAVIAFVKHSIDVGIIPNWDCFEDNAGSLSTARSLFFEATHEYNFISIFKKSDER